MTQDVVKSQPQKQPIETQPRQAEVEAYRQMDALDEQQIIDEQKGHVIDQYFYSFTVAGREIIGSSWAGIKFIASKMASLGHPIAVSELVIEEGQDSYKARAKAKDLATGEERWGVAEQPKVDEKGRRNMFAYPIAASKAQRNAIRTFVSEVVIQEGYREWKKKRTQTTEPTKDTASEQQPAPRTSSTVERPVPPEVSPAPVTEKKNETQPTEIPVTGTMTPSDIPQSNPVSPEPDWKILLSTGWIPEDIQRYPIRSERDKKDTAYGVINVRGSTAGIVPARPFPVDDPALQGYMVKQYLEGKKKAHPDKIDFELKHENGLLQGIIVKAELTKELIDDLVKQAYWTFQKAFEHQALR